MENATGQNKVTETPEVVKVIESFEKELSRMEESSEVIISKVSLLQNIREDAEPMSEQPDGMGFNTSD